MITLFCVEIPSAVTDCLESKIRILRTAEERCQPLQGSTRPPGSSRRWPPRTFRSLPELFHLPEMNSPSLLLSWPNFTLQNLTQVPASPPSSPQRAFPSNCAQHAPSFWHHNVCSSALQVSLYFYCKSPSRAEDGSDPFLNPL